MKKLIFSIALVIILTLSIAAPVLADALFLGLVQVTNVGSAVTGVATVFTMNTTTLISNGFAEADLSDVSMTYNGVQLPFQAGYGTNPWCVWVPSIGPTSVNYLFKAGGATGGTPRYFPGATGLNLGDPASLEIGNNGTIELTDTWIDTTAGGVIFTKPSSLTCVAGSGNITVTAYNAGAIDTYPSSSNVSSGSGTGAAGFTATPLPGTVSAGDLLLIMVQQANRTSGAAGVPSVAGFTLLDSGLYFGATDRASYYYKVATGGEVNFVVTGLGGGAGDPYTWWCVKILSSVYSGAPVIAAVNGSSANPNPPLLTTGFGSVKTLFFAAATSYNSFTGYPAGYSNTASGALNPAYWGRGDKQATAASEDPGTFTCSGATDWRAVTIGVKGKPSDINLTSAFATSEADSLIVSANGTSGDLELWINGIKVSNATLVAGILNNANNYQIGSTATPYIGTMKITVGGNIKGQWAWQYGATFTDLSGNGNTGTPSFRTTSSDADVSASLISFTPAESSELTGFTFGGDLPDIGVPVASPQMYTEGEYDTIPGAEAVNEMLATGGIPYSLWWFPFIYFSICIIGFLVYGATQGPMTLKSTSNPFDGSLLTMAVVMEALIVVAGIMNPVPLWPAYLFPIPAIAIIISRKHLSWG